MGQSATYCASHSGGGLPAARRSAGTVKAPKGADLSQVSVGEKVIVDFADSVIIAISNP